VGEHYNPDKKTHGNINSPNSHAGDLGNILSDSTGVAFVNKLSREQFSLEDYHPAIGRGIVVHEKQDDLGSGGNMTSLINGNSGNRLGCGIIAYANTGATLVSADRH
jgi:Cu-Zn family superoxide dismutase